MTQPVIALPGGVMPAAVRYAYLKSVIGSDVDFHAKDLEVYAGATPPSNYSIDLEIDELTRFADSLGARRFHLLGYSAGGFIGLAFAGVHPDRLLSLAVFEPGRGPGDLSPEAAALERDFRQALADQQGMDYMRTFFTRQVRPGVHLEAPSGPPEPWMQNRPAGIAAMMDAFVAYDFDRNQLRNCQFPVFYGYGDQTAAMVELEAARLAQLFPDIHIRRFQGIHHFVSPEQLYRPEHVQHLRDLWARAERDSLVMSAS